MDVGSWLRSPGLGRYEVVFRENSIDADVLQDLSEADLAQIGVTLRDRKRLRKAIASFATAEFLLRAESPLPPSTDAAEAVCAQT
jgi:hypothetical protein